MVQNICHFLGYNNALSKFSEFYFTVLYSEIASEKYKGFSNKYKGIFHFCSPYNIFRWFGIVSCIPVVHMLFLTLVLSYIWLSNAKCHISHIIYDIMTYMAYMTEMRYEIMYTCHYGCQKNCYDLRNAAHYHTSPISIL